MATVAFRRPACRTGPETPHGEITLQEPPDVPEVKGAGTRMLITVVPALMMSGGMMFPGWSRSGTTSASSRT
jgi:S-DNA-T family DNA segregation ATPase FtsK/SpoIIIE